jgi:YfiH family protein
MTDWLVESSPLGRIVVPPCVPPGFALFCTTVDFDGRLSGDAPSAITRFVAERFGIRSSLTTCTQVHGATVLRAQPEGTWRECDSCDALWSDTVGVTLGIKVADCLPIAMVDPVHEVIGDVHSGWRGTVRKITAVTIDAMARESGFDPAVSFAYLGPSIRACCFEIGEEVVTEFAAQYEDAERYVDRSRSRPHIDLPALTRDLLLSRGFSAAKIFDSQLCTRCDGSIFQSYRRDGRGESPAGRNLAFVSH